jgi:hypothetical protein
MKTVWILSPHYGTDWVDIQKRWIEKNTKDFNIRWIIYEAEPNCRHIRSLGNLMELLDQAAPQKYDLVAEFDSDAFPITPDWTSKVLEYLEQKYMFVAVQRLENPFRQRLNPHPSFCAWRYGTFYVDWHQWAGNPYIKAGTHRWKPLHRTNKVDLHRQMYAIYDDMIYHHGGGSRLATIKTEKFFQPGIQFFNDFFSDQEGFIKRLRYGC